MNKFTVDYSTFIDEKWSKRTKSLRRQQLKSIGTLFDSVNVCFIADYYINYEIGLQKLTDFFNHPRKYFPECPVSIYKTATRLGYMECLCICLKLIDQFPSESYVQYEKCKNNIQLNLDIEKKQNKSTKICGDFIQSIESLEPFIDKPMIISIKIIIKLLSLIDIETNYYGVLRISDLINTTLKKELSNDYSYLDLDTGVYTILAKCTKNKKTRTMILPKEFTDYVRLLYSTYPRPSKWLLTKGNYLEKYESTGISKHFKKITGVDYYELRHQFVKYLQTNSTVSDIKTISFNMGHSLRIAITTYNDIVCEEHCINESDDD